ncbi:hypothetical protein FK220_004220 [Flavobacteriaceae bacterium TP-CH-4]|uniref:Right handed beta helix domain-containing protein n=1 Tax=Pelagihabitans pacificus TaxID=2696054 RepID=A0A967E5F5_9FLAO|nr:flavodoxin family protein [Pelagihabitans pacificus]NHF58530.1 hypothetical protein [Pelagihabitans pacificus]
MKKYLYYLMLLLIPLVSCEKDNLDSKILEGTQAGDATTKVDLAASKEFFTVIGQSNPVVDLPAVQNAVDNYDRITLSGVFDFGSDEITGGVDITRPNVILKGPATILNGAKTQSVPELGKLRVPISIRAPGVEVRDIEFNCNHDGILVYVQENGKPVVIYSNTVSVGEFGGGVAIAATPGGIKVLNNTISAFYPYLAIETTGNTEIVQNEMQECFECVFIFGFDHKLDILDNIMSTNSFAFEGMFIGSWQVTTETGPDWGDNPPVRIIDNTIEIEGIDAAGIIVGTSAHGINNTLVKGNVITGTGGYSGLLKEPYGRNNRFINNDLSGLTTYGPQLWLHGGRNNHFQNNKLGSVLPIPGGGFAPVQQDAATLVSTVNWHLNDGLNTPDPLNEGNHFSNNDYGQTGVSGWSEDTGSIGAVLLLDFIQRFDSDGFPFEEPFAMENFVSEKKFPAGTDLCDQVLDIGGTNHIAGWKACESHTKMAYEMASKSYKNFGQRHKDRNRKRMEILEKFRE